MVTPEKPIEVAPRGPGFLGGEHVDAADAERDRQVRIVEEQEAGVDLARHRMQRRPEEGIGAARRDELRHQRGDIVLAVHEGAGGVEHGGGAALGQEREPALEAGHQRVAAPVARQRLDRVVRSFLAVAIGEPGGEGGARDHRFIPCMRGGPIGRRR